MVWRCPRRIPRKKEYGNRAFYEVQDRGESEALECCPAVVINPAKVIALLELRYLKSLIDACFSTER
jgi:hypothetical protein